MRFYETLYIVDSNLENKVLEKAMADIGNELNKTNAKIIKIKELITIFKKWFKIQALPADQLY